MQHTNDSSSQARAKQPMSRADKQRVASYRRRLKAAGIATDEVPDDIGEFRCRMARHL